MRAVITVFNFERKAVRISNLSVKFYTLGIVKCKRVVTRQFTATTQALGLSSNGTSPSIAQTNLHIFCLNLIYRAIKRGELAKFLLQRNWEKMPKRRSLPSQFVIERWEFEYSG